MMDNHVGVCLDHEHDWCDIPLHEDAQICARCGEIRHPQISEASSETTDLLLSSHSAGDPKDKSVAAELTTARQKMAEFHSPRQAERGAFRTTLAVVLGGKRVRRWRAAGYGLSLQ